MKTNSVPVIGTLRSLVIIGFLVLPANSLLAETEFDCVIEASNIAQLSPRTQGVINSIEVKKGQAVKRGNVIARIDYSMEEAVLKVLKARENSSAAIDAQSARVLLTKAQLDRAQALVQRNALSPDKLEPLKYDYALATSQLRQAQVDALALQAEIERARVAVENTKILAPFDGVVTEITLSVGEYATADRHVAVIAQTNPIYVESYLPITIYDSIHPATAVRIHPDYPVGSIIDAKILMMDPMFDPSSRTFGVRVALPNPDGHIVAGQRCRLEISKF
jgi:RND family efflux transporter MFP subunit